MFFSAIYSGNQSECQGGPCRIICVIRFVLFDLSERVNSETILSQLKCVWYDF